MQALARLTLLLLAGVFSIASGSSSSNRPAPPVRPSNSGLVGGAPPASQPMDPAQALGLWKTNFGPVKIEADTSQAPGSLMGVWVYDRDGQEIIGYFSGPASGNVLNFTWQEPSPGAPLTGSGYLVFDPGGASFTGRWWTANRDRGGDWNGWREEQAQQAAPAPASEY